MIDLTEPERQLAAQILEQDLEHLQVEINRSDAIEYRQSLRDRSHVLESVLGKLKAGAPREQPAQPPRVPII